MIVLHGIPNCDTVKKARAWLSGRGIEHRFHDLRRDGVPGHRLDAWIAQIGWERLLNRKGTTWRRLDASAQAAALDPPGARALMLREPSVIRRPVVDWPGGSCSAGFDPADWGARLDGHFPASAGFT
jgi:arsenate reductase (glutaredoxin)